MDGIKIRAERRMGAELAGAGFGERGGDRKSKVIVTLDQIGVTGNDSKRWQAIAAVPELWNQYSTSGS